MGSMRSQESAVPTSRPHHRIALWISALWSALFVGWLVGHVQSRQDQAPPVTTAPSVDAWQVHSLQPDSRHPGRSGVIRLGHNAAGLVIQATVDGPPPRWPRGNGISSDGDHVAVWLADGTPAGLPPIGWGNQFGPTHMDSADYSADLDDDDRKRDERLAQRRAWYLAQVAYRRTVMKLFERRWRFVPGQVEEFAATPAFASLNAADRKDLAPLAVRGMPSATFSTPDAATYAVEILIPWEAFPPIRTLSVQDLRVMVEVVSSEEYLGGWPRRSRLPSGSETPGEDLLPIRLANAHQHTLTTCRFTLDDALAYSYDAVPYIRPSGTTVLDGVVLVENTAQGYQYDPDPDSRSPIATISRFWTRTLPDGSVLGGPPVAWTRDETTSRALFRIDDPTALGFRTAENGDLLVRNGPLQSWSRFGSGACGACPRIGVAIFRLRLADRSVHQLLSLLGVVSSDADLRLSDDWSLASYFTLDIRGMDDARWIRTDHRLASHGMRYVQQPDQVIDAPPEPRVFNFEGDFTK